MQSALVISEQEQMRSICANCGAPLGSHAHTDEACPEIHLSGPLYSKLTHFRPLFDEETFAAYAKLRGENPSVSPLHWAKYFADDSVIEMERRYQSECMSFYIVEGEA